MSTSFEHKTDLHTMSRSISSLKKNTNIDPKISTEHSDFKSSVSITLINSVSSAQKSNGGLCKQNTVVLKLLIGDHECSDISPTSSRMVMSAMFGLKIRRLNSCADSGMACPPAESAINSEDSVA